MESAGKRLRTRTDIGKDIERCLDDLKITHAELAEMLNVSDKTVDRMIGGKMPGCCSEDYSERGRRGHDHWRKGTYY